MKIVLVARDLRKFSLASSFRVRSFLDYFLQQGHEVVVICQFPPEDLRYQKSAKIISVRLDYRGLKKIIYRAAGFPDPLAIWSGFCYRNQSVRESVVGADVILASSPPHGVQKLALLLSKKFKMPLVCDFRDDFLTNHRTRWLTSIHKYYGKKLESALVESADRVVLNTNEIKSRFESRHSGWSRKFECITNGFDEAGFSGISKGEGRKKTIVYCGSDYFGYAPEIISEIAQIISRNRLNLGEDLKIRSAGPGDWSLSNNYGFWDHLGIVDRNSVSQLVCDASVLFLLMPPGEKEPSGTVPLKAYEYLRSGTSIVYFGERGSTTDLLRQFSGTYCFTRYQQDACYRCLVETAISGGDFLPSRKSRLGSYEMSALSARMLNVMVEASRLCERVGPKETLI